ncbi:unnamed protein product [Knipowitschia caucasica]
MTIWCNACQCHVSTPCASHHQSEDQRAASLCRRFRSTKGASKARRDQINNEIRIMRGLLPITSEDQERLSYLHSMAAICAYIKKSVILKGLTSKEESNCSVPSDAFLQALHGFILVSTAQGRLVCLSENVEEYLGISMVDVLQGDSLLDMVERSDVEVVKSNLDFDSNLSPERTFVCSMQTSKAFKLQNGASGAMLVRGRFQFFPSDSPSSSSSSSSFSSSSSGPVTEPLFVALCTPTVNQLRPGSSVHPSFCSLHGLDMSFSHVSDCVLYHLGFSSEEITLTSWYSLIHPDDLSPAAESHRTLVQADSGFQLQMVLRLQCKDLSWTWIYIRASKEAQSIRCTNFIISETEARFLQRKLNNETSGLSQICHSSTATPTTSSTHHKPSKCLKRQRSQDEESCARSRKTSCDSWQDQTFADLNQDDRSYGPKCDNPYMFTPPYTPNSSASSIAQDLIMDVLSSPESSPSYFPPAPPICGLPYHSPMSLPNTQPSDHSSTGSHSPLSTSSSSSLSPSYEDFSTCTSDARLVPDCLSVSNESSTEDECTLHQDDFGLDPGLLPPTQSPTTQGTTFEYSEREREEISVLAQQISSLANSFDMFSTLSPFQNDSMMNCFPHHAPSLPAELKPELILDDCIFDSILNDLELVAVKGSARNMPCQMLQQPPSPLGASMDITERADRLSSGGVSMDQNNGLHQLNRYIHSSLQQDGFAEENLY